MDVILTTGEKLFISRRRKKNTQAVEAQQLKVSLRLYGQWERDQNLDPELKVEIPDITDNEHCVILRRRRQETQGQLAKNIGCCRYWVNLMEQNNVSTKQLVGYWNERLQLESDSVVPEGMVS